MANKTQYFFGTRDDFQKLFTELESANKLVYAISGRVPIDNLTPFSTMLTPKLGIAETGNTDMCTQYLIFKDEANVRSIYQPRFNDYIVNLHEQPEAVGMRTGGFLKEGVIVGGLLWNCSDDLRARELFKTIQNTLRRHSTNFDGYLVCREAEQLFDAGWRLTVYEAGDKKYDIRRPQPKINDPKGTKTSKTKKLSLEKTWQKLEAAGAEMPRTEKGKPFVPKSMPNFDDETLGVEFFRTEVEDADYSFLTLPRTFFGRSELRKVNYQNSDLSESRMCWNDFIECDFSNADLAKCDMRASNFENCNFSGANLEGTDLRRAVLTNCNFTGANLKSASALPSSHTHHKNGGSIAPLLSNEQSSSVSWIDDAGEEPPGG